MEVSYQSVPFPHWIVDRMLDAALVAEAYAVVPGAEWPHWVRYNNDCERGKRACNDLDRLPVPLANLPLAMSCTQFPPSEPVTRIGASLTPDLHGAGIHVTDPGGWLQSHLDYALHPVTGMERRLNCILHLNPEWREEWGGALVFCDDMGAGVRAIYPQFNRAVIWEPTDTAYHATGEVAVEAPPRVTAAVYFVAPPRPGLTRKRALFIPRR